MHKLTVCSAWEVSFSDVSSVVMRLIQRCRNFPAESRCVSLCAGGKIPSRSVSDIQSGDFRKKLPADMTRESDVAYRFYSSLHQIIHLRAALFSANILLRIGWASVCVYCPCRAGNPSVTIVCLYFGIELRTDLSSVGTVSSGGYRVSDRADRGKSDGAASGGIKGAAQTAGCLEAYSGEQYPSAGRGLCGGADEGGQRPVCG